MASGFCRVLLGWVSSELLLRDQLRLDVVIKMYAVLGFHDRRLLVHVLQFEKVRVWWFQFGRKTMVDAGDLDRSMGRGCLL